MTSAIARMNCFLHGIEDFEIARGDTLAEPKFVAGDRLRRFDVCLANPPYSIRQWDRDAFAADPWGPNVYGTPPQGRADYAFWQHVLRCLDAESGRCEILFPHGVLFRSEEREMRRKLVEDGLIDAAIGLGLNLFYNSPMEDCVAVRRTRKAKPRPGRVRFVNAVGDVSRERPQSFLADAHIARIVAACDGVGDVRGYARSVSLEKIRGRAHSLSIALYIRPEGTTASDEARRPVLKEAVAAWEASSAELRRSMDRLFATLEPYLAGRED